MLSLSDSDNRVLNSRPPKPAPSTTIRGFMEIHQSSCGRALETAPFLRTRQAGQSIEENRLYCRDELHSYFSRQQPTRRSNECRRRRAEIKRNVRRSYPAARWHESFDTLRGYVREQRENQRRRRRLK